MLIDYVFPIASQLVFGGYAFFLQKSVVARSAWPAGQSSRSRRGAAAGGVALADGAAGGGAVAVDSEHGPIGASDDADEAEVAALCDVEAEGQISSEHGSDADAGDQPSALEEAAQFLGVFDDGDGSEHGDPGVGLDDDLADAAGEAGEGPTDVGPVCGGVAGPSVAGVSDPGGDTVPDDLLPGPGESVAAPAGAAAALAAAGAAEDPPPSAPKKRGPVAPRGPKEDWVVVAHVWDESGSIYCGLIKWSQKFQMMSAWCQWRDPAQDPSTFAAEWGTHHTCRLDRNVKKDQPDSSYFRGRPLSFLVAWLHLSGSVDSRGLHFNLHKTITTDLRIRTRTWIDSQSSFDLAKSKERPRRDGEPFEHDHNP